MPSPSRLRDRPAIDLDTSLKRARLQFSAPPKQKKKLAKRDGGGCLIPRERSLKVEEHGGLVREDAVVIDVAEDATLFVISWMSTVSGQGMGQRTPECFSWSLDNHR